MLLVRIRTILGLLCLGMFMVSCILDGGESASLQLPAVTTGRLDTLLTGIIPGAPADTGRAIDSIRMDFVEDSGTALVLEWLVSESPVSVDLVSDSGPRPYSNRYQSSRGEIVGYNQFGGPIRYTVYGDTVTLTFPVFRSGHHMLRISGGHGVPFRVHVARKTGIDAWLKAPDAWEDDNVPGRATLLQEGVSQTHTMTASVTTDVDWFRFPVKTGWNYWVERVDSVAGRTLLGDLYTGAQKRLGGDAYHAGQSGEMYYRAISTWGAGDIYRITLHASQQEYAGLVVPDSFEMDDSLHPVVLSAGQRQIRATLHSYSDSDWFRIAVDSGKTYSFTLKDTSLSAGIGLWDAQGELNPASVLQGKDSSVRVTYPAGRSGEWIIQVVGSKVTAYSITIGDSAGIRADAVQDRYEPDGIPALASLLPADSSVQNRTFHWNGNKSDTDYIAFMADSGKTYTLRFHSKLMTAPEVEILSPSLKPEASVAMSSIYRKTVTFACVRTGRYLARARGYDDQYTVLMTAADTLPAWALPEVGEPDDGPATAQVLRSGESTVRHVDLADADWIQVPVEKNRRYTLSLDNALLLEKARIFLAPVADMAGTPNFWMEAMGGKSGQRSFDAYEDGIACFKLNASGIDSGTLIPYTFKVASEPF